MLERHKLFLFRPILDCVKELASCGEKGGCGRDIEDLGWECPAKVGPLHHPRIHHLLDHPRIHQYLLHHDGGYMDTSAGNVRHHPLHRPPYHVE